jgi:hypothetical protein
MPLANGGISYLVEATGKDQYQYWVYGCPPDIPFSAKQAIKSLKEVKERGTKPWHFIQTDGEPILDSLIRSVINEDNGMPSEIAHQALVYLIHNNYSEIRKDEITQSNKTAIDKYASNKIW